jgi:hypothetical protein
MNYIECLRITILVTISLVFLNGCEYVQSCGDLERHAKEAISNAKRNYNECLEVQKRLVKINKQLKKEVLRRELIVIENRKLRKLLKETQNKK